MSQRTVDHYAGTKRRQHYRLEYPMSGRPVLIDSKKDKYEVVNISENGVKLFRKKGTFYLPLQLFVGKIKFHDDKCEAIEGEVIRVSKNEVVVFLSKAISYRRIVKEQLYFRKHSVAVV